MKSLSLIFFSDRIGRISVEAENLASVNQVGEDVTLHCNYNLDLPGFPKITWYKVKRGSSRKLAEFDTNLDVGEEVNLF